LLCPAFRQTWPRQCAFGAHRNSFSGSGRAPDVVFNAFDMDGAFSIKDYLQPRDHAFKIEMMPRLIKFDGLSIFFSIGAALFISIKQRQNILLSILAAALGNIGTIVWMIRRGKQTQSG
jgi:hypothetical protein